MPANKSRQVLQTAVVHALQQAPDFAAVAFDDARLHLVAPLSETGLVRCVSAACERRREVLRRQSGVQ